MNKMNVNLPPACYRPQTKLLKGNVFTSVCQEFCAQGTPPAPDRLGRPPWQAEPPWQADPPSRRLLQRTVRILLECILVYRMDLDDNALMSLLLPSQ